MVLIKRVVVGVGWQCGDRMTQDKAKGLSRKVFMGWWEDSSYIKCCVWFCRWSRLLTHLVIRRSRVLKLSVFKCSVRAKIMISKLFQIVRLLFK